MESLLFFYRLIYFDYRFVSFGIMHIIMFHHFTSLNRSCFSLNRVYFLLTHVLCYSLPSERFLSAYVLWTVKYCICSYFYELINMDLWSETQFFIRFCLCMQPIKWILNHTWSRIGGGWGLWMIQRPFLSERMFLVPEFLVCDLFS